MQQHRSSLMGGEADQSLSKYQRQPAHPCLASSVDLNLVNFPAAVFQESCEAQQVSEDWAPVLGKDSVGRHLQYMPQHQVRVWKDIDPSQSLNIPTLPAHLYSKSSRHTVVIVSAELQTVHKQGLNGNEWCQNRAPDPEAGISSQDRTTRGYSLAGGGRTRPMQLAGNDAPCCPIRSANSQTNIQ
ncbi:hypothetical protein BDP67DRAFT_484861 [Colletotrichum lupini]|nr:hypothetical protein BDP67DRAFT_484861 [Colletotrichum lupini]